MPNKNRPKKARWRRPKGQLPLNKQIRTMLNRCVRAHRTKAARNRCVVKGYAKIDAKLNARR